MLGRRIDFGREAMKPHNLTLTMLGAGLLWFGWFGFNAGSALGATGLAAIGASSTRCFAGCHRACWPGSRSSGSVTAMRRRSAPPPVCVSGLVAITPCVRHR